MSEDRLVNIIVTLLQEVARHESTDLFENGGGFYLWEIAKRMEIEEAVDQELYHREGGPA